MSTGSVTVAAITLVLAAAHAVAQPSHTPQATGALRTVHDASRNRVWVLEQDALYLYDAANRTLKGRFELRGWIYADARYACAPGLAIDGQGAAIVSSNVVPALWRVDAEKSAVTLHEPALDADDGRDIGFTGLVYAAEQGVFFAVSGAHGSLWRIDPSLRKAQKIRVAVPRGCAQDDGL